MQAPSAHSSIASLRVLRFADITLWKGISISGIHQALCTQVPEIAQDYWKLGEDATMRDLLLAVRADEACHSHVNHTFAEMGRDEKNPFMTGTHLVPTA